MTSLAPLEHKQQMLQTFLQDENIGEDLQRLLKADLDKPAALAELKPSFKSLLKAPLFWSTLTFTTISMLSTIFLDNLTKKTDLWFPYSSLQDMIPLFLGVFVFGLAALWSAHKGIKKGIGLSLQSDTPKEKELFVQAEINSEQTTLSIRGKEVIRTKNFLTSEKADIEDTVFEWKEQLANFHRIKEQLKDLDETIGHNDDAQSLQRVLTKHADLKVIEKTSKNRVFNELPIIIASVFVFIAFAFSLVIMSDSLTHSSIDYKNTLPVAYQARDALNKAAQEKNGLTSKAQIKKIIAAQPSYSKDTKISDISPVDGGIKVKLKVDNAKDIKFVIKDKRRLE